MGPHREYLEFVHLFNSQKFFEAHEVLEILWRRERGPERNFYQGLIQIAAALVHFQRGTPEGGRKVLESAAKNLERFKPFHLGLNLEKLSTETAACLTRGGPVPRIEVR